MKKFIITATLALGLGIGVAGFGAATTDSPEQAVMTGYAEVADLRADTGSSSYYRPSGSRYAWLSLFSCTRSWYCLSCLSLLPRRGACLHAPSLWSMLLPSRHRLQEASLL
jgi:hypothetical protein